MTVLLRDVGTLREAEAQQAAQARAEAARRAMAEFIGRLGHEMRTPLNAVLGFSQLLQTDEHEPLAPAAPPRRADPHGGLAPAAPAGRRLRPRGAGERRAAPGAGAWRRWR